MEISRLTCRTCFTKRPFEWGARNSSIHAVRSISLYHSLPNSLRLLFKFNWLTTLKRTAVPHASPPNGISFQTNAPRSKTKKQAVKQISRCGFRKSSRATFYYISVWCARPVLKSFTVFQAPFQCLLLTIHIHINTASSYTIQRYGMAFHVSVLWKRLVTKPFGRLAIGFESHGNGKPIPTPIHFTVSYIGYGWRRRSRCFHIQTDVALIHPLKPSFHIRFPSRFLKCQFNIKTNFDYNADWKYTLRFS